MITSTDPQLLYLILFLGAFSGAILTWAFILATPNIINKRQNKIVEARQSLENELKQLMITKSKLADFNKTQQHSYSIEEIDIAINKDNALPMNCMMIPYNGWQQCVLGWNNYPIVLETRKYWRNLIFCEKR